MHERRRRLPLFVVLAAARGRTGDDIGVAMVAAAMAAATSPPPALPLSFSDLSRCSCSVVKDPKVVAMTRNDGGDLRYFRHFKSCQLKRWGRFLAFRKNEDTPNSEDDDAFPVFREETRFGKLRLEVGMKFNTEMNFKEAVREYCIQKGRRVRFKKNDNVRCRALCRGEECPCVIYVSKDSESVCW
ncbi:hypothetical protein Ahy_A03g010529 [Arachis hypogaea]|uniref:Transposase MuDR plant domain-containing protein n=1 Tax=Arachis hypogaea TaxID=3818 RepID=A0A445DMR0_ARAHY|nr:hypothetical protein Ahy_A03g010529 [Arachis hypogaea]